MSALLNTRSTVGDRLRAGLIAAMDELNVASLEDVLALASALSGLQVYPHFALTYFTENPERFHVEEVGSRVLIRQLTA